MFFSLLLSFSAHAVNRDAITSSLRELHAQFRAQGVDGAHQIAYDLRDPKIERDQTSELDPATSAAFPFEVSLRSAGQNSGGSSLVIKPLGAELMVKNMTATMELKFDSPDMFNGDGRDAAKIPLARDLKGLISYPSAQMNLHFRFSFDHNWQMNETGKYTLSFASRSEAQLRQMLRLDEVTERLRRQFNAPKLSIKMTTLMAWSNGGRDNGPTWADVTPFIGLTLNLPPNVSPLDAYVALYLHTFAAITSDQPRALPAPAAPSNLLTRLFRPKACAPSLEIVPREGSTALVVQNEKGGPPAKGGVVTLRTPLGNLDIYLKRHERD